jgi:hypothetical protein
MDLYTALSLEVICFMLAGLRPGVLDLDPRLTLEHRAPHASRRRSCQGFNFIRPSALSLSVRSVALAGA